MDTVSLIGQALRQRGGFEVVTDKLEPTKLRLLGRVSPASQTAWASVRRVLLLQSGRSGWSCDISRQYFLVDGVERYAWRLIFQSDQPIEACTPSIVSTVAQAHQQALARAADVDEEVDLVGASRSRTQLVKGKGAQDLMTAKVGAPAIAEYKQQQQG